MQMNESVNLNNNTFSLMHINNLNFSRIDEMQSKLNENDQEQEMKEDTINIQVI